MMQHTTDFAPFLPDLFALTAGSFTCETIKRHGLARGWAIDYEDVRLDLQFALAEDLLLWVGPCDGSQAVLVFLPVAWWSETDYERDAYLLQRPAFDAAFATAVDKVRQRLGEPVAQGEVVIAVDPASPYRHAIWTGERGVLIVQQQNRDEQFGPEINLWLQAWTPGEPLPSFPLF